MQPSGEMPDIEGFLRAVLRNQKPAWPFGHDEESVSRFIERAEYHGVLPLLHDRLQADPESGVGWPAEVRQRCRENALAQTMWELRHRALLTEVFVKLAEAGIIPVVFKGTALAYILYPEASLRSRGDTDLLIPPGTQNQTAEILEQIGFKRDQGMSGESVAYEANFTRSEPAGGTHTLDVHWRINNSELLSRLFEHEDLLSASQPLPLLGPNARSTALVDALLIACMHRATHKHNPYYVNGVAYYSGDRLIWLYDIHLLSGAFTADQWSEFVRAAEVKGLCAVCLDGIERARMAFFTDIPERVREHLSQPGGSEKIARYFAAGALRQQWMDFCAIPGLLSKLRFAAQTLFPPADYMRQKYPQGGWLPWLYLRRATGGVIKRFKRTLPTG